MKRLSLIVFFVCLMASVASATWYWEGDVDNNWSVTGNWNNGTVSPPSTVPHTATESMYIPSTSGIEGTPRTVNVDVSDQVGTLMMGRTGGTINPPIGNANVNLNNSAVTLTVSTASGELVSVAYTAGYTNALNVSAGRLNVYRGDGTGELRLNHVYTAATIGNVNLSGTGIIDVEYLNRGGKAGGGTFTATGGTLVARYKINKWGTVGDGGGFSQGGCLLEVGGDADTIHTLELGSGEDMSYFMDSTSKIKFDLGSAAGVAGTNWDLCLSRGNYTIDGELLVDFTVAPTVGDHWDVWKILSGKENTYSGSGSFDTIPSNIQASWINTGAGTDILRLTYVPEPATIALLSLGLLLVRRNRK